MEEYRYKIQCGPSRFMADPEDPPRLELFALGTPVMDGFAQVEADFLAARKLALGSSNFMNGEQLAVLEKALGPNVRSWEPGDNARNLCESYVRLQRLAKKTASGPADFGVMYAGTLGSDEVGTRFLNTLRAHSIQPRMQFVNGASGRILALVTPEGQRTFAVALGVSEQYAMPADLPKARCFFLTSITLLTPSPISRVARAMVEQMRRSHSRIAIALESPAMLAGKKEDALSVARKADVLFLNEEELKAIGLDEATLPALAPLIFLKEGAQGSVIFKDGKKLADVACKPALRVVDTTGAGDNFAAGVLWGLEHGRDPAGAARIGAQLGAAAVSKFGASLPNEFRLEA